tara:strand:- start:1119 stop:1538 length:420 start_codon:yes stop_codon:yes gene_type:complete
MKFKIKEVGVDHLKVDYDDGSHAVVPIRKGMVTEQIYEVVEAFNNINTEFDKVEDVPVKADDTWHEIKIEEEPLLNYTQARAAALPNHYEFFHADYLARKGDDSYHKKIDERIEKIYNKFPKGDKLWTQKECREFDSTK